ncbi:diguanylate cyclase [[Clostridium] innocuum]|uniref:GGDEF domain-containing protein n=2 Tax=Clostridium innocuum TaxID=1522 RepID=UPI003A4D8B07
MHVRLIDLKREYELCMILSEKAKLSNDVYALAFAYTFISDFYLASKKNKDCIRYLERARKLCESTEYTELLARIYNFYGMYYNSNYEEIKALEAYLKSMEAAEKCQNLTLMLSAYNNIATCFELKRNYTEAIHYYKKCYELLQSMEKNSAYSKAIVLSNLCNCEYRLKDAAALCAYFSRFEDLDRQSFEESMNLLYLFCKLMYLRLHEAVSVQAVMEELLQAYREFYTIILTIEDTDMEDNSSGLIAALELYRTKERQVSLEKENEQLERLMNIDDLTNIYNRRCFNEDITATDLQKEKIVAVAMLDIDYFKEYNDIYGHQMGDQALVKIGRCMKQYEKKGEIQFYRYGGDEFSAIFIGQSEESVRKTMAALTHDIREQKIPHKGSRTAQILTLSFGYAFSSQEPVDMTVLIRQADEQLYQHKKLRRQRCKHADAVTGNVQ